MHFVYSSLYSSLPTLWAQNCFDSHCIFWPFALNLDFANQQMWWTGKQYGFFFPNRGQGSLCTGHRWGGEERDGGNYTWANKEYTVLRKWLDKKNFSAPPHTSVQQRLRVHGCWCQTQSRRFAGEAAGWIYWNKKQKNNMQFQWKGKKAETQAVLFDSWH